MLARLPQKITSSVIVLPVHLLTSLLITELLGPWSNFGQTDRQAELSNEFPKKERHLKTQQPPCHEQQQWVPTRQLQTMRFIPCQHLRGGGHAKDRGIASRPSCKTQDTSPWGNQASLNLLLMQKLISSFICFLIHLDLVNLKH